MANFFDKNHQSASSILGDNIICCFFIVLTGLANGQLNDDSAGYYGIVRKVGTRCLSNKECIYYKNTYCKIVSPTCGIGICSCIPGFAFDPFEEMCKRAVKIGQACNGDGDYCTTENAICDYRSGRCRCAGGFKLSLDGVSCVSERQAVILGDTCRSSDECLINMECVDGECKCLAGYRPYVPYICKKRNLGDKCRDDRDCSQVENTACINAMCQCQPNYKPVKYIASEAELLTSPPSNSCIPVSESQVRESYRCNTVIGPDNTEVCAMPFVCTDCGSGSGTYCARILPGYMTAAAISYNKPAASAALSIIVTIISITLSSD